MSNKIRLCPKCKEREKSRHSSYCKPCESIRVKKYAKKTNYKTIEQQRQRIRELIQESKDKPCADCGIKYPYYVMDFDHIRGTKKYNISTLVRTAYALETVQKEIDKCEVVCSNCHRERTHQWKQSQRA